MKTLLLSLLAVIALLLTTGLSAFAQVGINTDNSTPDNSAMLDVKSNTKGILIPRLTTTERNNIASPATSLIIFNTTTQCFEAYNTITSSWETIHCFECPVPITPTAGTHVPSPTQIIWNWNTISGVTGYKWNTTNDYNTATDMGTATTKTETGLTCNTDYTRYAWTYNSCGSSVSTTLTQMTSSAPASPTPATHVPLLEQITWKWHPVPSASGYKWNTSNDYNSAIDQGTDTTRTETNLLCGTYYTRYVWSYSNCGNSEGTTLIQQTNACSGYPTVTTSAATGITQTTATSGGNVTSDGGNVVLFRGVCWNTSPNPTMANNYTTNGGGIGGFVSNLTGLTSNTLYYVRAYAVNSGGTAYGNEVTFVTLPAVTTTDVTDITQTTATSGGNVAVDGGATVTARGVCWNTSANPTLVDNHTTDGNGTGIFISTITGLTGNTVYYLRAYVTNSTGTGYGNEITFTTAPVLAIVTTDMAIYITLTTATSGGNVTSDGGASVTARGVCWSTSANPTTADSHTTDGNGTGVFVSDLTGLDINTLYYVRAYSTNSVGTAYGNEISFTTLLNPILPTVTTTAITNITQTTATSGGNVLSDGGATVIFRGVCWSTNPNPNIADSYTTDGSGTGVFVSNLINLTPNTLYYVRAYALNNIGTAYGNEVSFYIYSIGQSYGGGIIFYIDNMQQHGLISATSDQTGSAWGCYGTSISGTSTAIGTGQANTNAIIAGCNTAGIAARICNDLVLNGYDDWFLPSKDELNQMYLQKTVIGGFAGIGYWSSSECCPTGAWYQNFNDGIQAFANKDLYIGHVRAIRAF